VPFASERMSAATHRLPSLAPCPNDAATGDELHRQSAGRLSAGRRVKKIRQAKRPHSIPVRAGGALRGKAPPRAFRADCRYGERLSLGKTENLNFERCSVIRIRPTKLADSPLSPHLIIILVGQPAVV